MNSITWGAYLVVLVASLTGSLHCVGMCGGLMVNAVKSPKEAFNYHLGRLLTYISLGALAGLLGESIFSSSLLQSFQVFTSIIMGLFFCWMAVRAWSGKTFHFSIIPLRFLSNKKWISSSLLVGVSSGLLPCGWLHTFVIASIATQSPLQGALLLFFFWLGTVPALTASHLALQRMSAPLRSYSTKILSIVLLIVGISTLTLKSYALFKGAESNGEHTCPMHSTQ